MRCKTSSRYAARWSSPSTRTRTHTHIRIHTLAQLKFWLIDGLGLPIVLTQVERDLDETEGRLNGTLRSVFGIRRPTGLEEVTRTQPRITLTLKPYPHAHALLARSRRLAHQVILGNAVASRALADLRVMRKIALADINRLEMTLVRGDPLLSFLRDAIARARGEQPPPIYLPTETQVTITCTLALAVARTLAPAFIPSPALYLAINLNFSLLPSSSAIPPTPHLTVHYM